jgi:hypothetical protein
MHSYTYAHTYALLHVHTHTYALLHIHTRIARLQVLLCSVSPTLQVLASLPLQCTLSMQWAMRQLFVLTQTHTYAVCVALPGTGPTFQGDLPVVQLVLEASYAHTYTHTSICKQLSSLL